MFKDGYYAGGAEAGMGKHDPAALCQSVGRKEAPERGHPRPLCVTLRESEGGRQGRSSAPSRYKGRDQSCVSPAINASGAPMLDGTRPSVQPGVECHAVRTLDCIWNILIHASRSHQCCMVPPGRQWDPGL